MYSLNNCLMIFNFIHALSIFAGRQGARRKVAENILPLRSYYYRAIILNRMYEINQLAVVNFSWNIIQRRHIEIRARSPSLSKSVCILLQLKSVQSPLFCLS